MLFWSRDLIAEPWPFLGVLVLASNVPSGPNFHNSALTEKTGH